VPERVVNQAATPSTRVAGGRPVGRVRHAHAATHADEGGVAAWVRRECIEQGVPEKLEDAVILAKIVILAYDGSATPSKSP
jgi:hypothetical protein